MSMNSRVWPRQRKKKWKHPSAWRAAHRMLGAGVWWDFIAPFCDRYTFTWFSYFRMKKISYLFIWKKPQDIAALACAIPQMWHEGRSNMASTAVLMPLRDEPPFVECVLLLPPICGFWLWCQLMSDVCTFNKFLRDGTLYRKPILSGA